MLSTGESQEWEEASSSVPCSVWVSRQPQSFRTGQSSRQIKSCPRRLRKRALGRTLAPAAWAAPVTLYVVVSKAHTGTSEFGVLENAPLHVQGVPMEINPHPVKAQTPKKQ